MLIGEMYQRWTLDCLIEVGHAVSCDFIERYLNYREVAVVGNLASLRARTGNDPDWPDAAQRAAIYGALLGPSDGEPVARYASPFHESTAALRDAAVKYSERVFDTGEPMLRRAFMDALQGLRAYLVTLTGKVVETGDTQTKNIFRAAAAVLRDTEVAHAFGLSALENDQWPLEYENYDGTRAYLVEEITRVLAPQRTGDIKRSRFVVIQRVASRGRTTIEQAFAIDAVQELARQAHVRATEVANEAQGKRNEARQIRANVAGGDEEAAREAEPRAVAADAEADRADARASQAWDEANVRADQYTAEIRELISSAYSWETALRDLAAEAK